MDDRVDLGPRDQGFVLGSDACDKATSLAKEIPWEQSPTRNKNMEMTHLNREARM